MVLVKILRGALRFMANGLVGYGWFVAPMPMPAVYPLDVQVRSVTHQRRRGPHRCPPDGRPRRHYPAFRCAAIVRRS